MADFKIVRDQNFLIALLLQGWNTTATFVGVNVIPEKASLYVNAGSFMSLSSFSIVALKIPASSCLF
jgi:hypothetical protein